MSLQKSTKTQSIMERRSFEQDKFFSICRKGSSTDLIKWLQKYPNFVVNQPEGLTGNTGLHKAALSELNSKAKAEILLNHGANPSVRNDFHETPAHSAAKAGNLETSYDAFHQKMKYATFWTRIFCMLRCKLKVITFCNGCFWT